MIVSMFDVSEIPPSGWYLGLKHLGGKYEVNNINIKQKIGVL